jgi:hypothetical protein
MLTSSAQLTLISSHLICAIEVAYDATSARQGAANARLHAVHVERTPLDYPEEAESYF